MLDFENARSLMDDIRDYYLAHKGGTHESLKAMYYSAQHPNIDKWTVREYQGTTPASNEILWQSMGSSPVGEVTIERYLLRHSRYLEMPLLWIHRRRDQQHRPVVLWIGENGKASPQDWPQIEKQIAAGYDVISFDRRGLGETRMPFKAVSPDDPALAKLSFDEAYVSPLSGVLADYTYNSILTGRPYFLQSIEDVEIASRFARTKLAPTSPLSVTGDGIGGTVATAAAEVLRGIKLIPPSGEQPPNWSEIVDQKRELWPIQLLLPGGAYVH
jgi:hypothetical protein